MSNISVPDWEVLQTKGRPEDWLLFERVFTSAEAMERKPTWDSTNTSFVKLLNTLTRNPNLK
jgi:hypothetical protein